METNYRAAYDKYWNDIKKKLPEEVSAYRAVTFNSINHQFELNFFGSAYVFDCLSERICRKGDKYVPDIMGSIIMLNYLAYAGPFRKKENRWVSLKEIANGGALFYPAFQKNSIIPLIKAFGWQSQKLLVSAAAMNGKPTNLGDASVTFQAFPEIPMCVIVWEGDEEVQANATILFDPSVKDFLHIESIIGLGMYLSEKLVNSFS
ncbi:hypothetical protein DEAC_c06580 [Desulfosporosinus acididurans]|uniref:DUF3786 domain-containing protein n=1 Tax=Desulfosporosinus acididurans TaxID=476652 RepID=A0A0J1IS03_9FIRM|nr:DUF3786 domain-containing protein [Desulfosporosinus acididurans]KLU67446.1 hypothetical protein DEAC_c06580 [Desulfosporosinus acididurans]